MLPTVDDNHLSAALPPQNWTPSMDATKLPDAMDPTKHDTKTTQSSIILNDERTTSTSSNLTPHADFPELSPDPVDLRYTHLCKLRINYMRRQHAHLRAFFHSRILNAQPATN